MFSPFVAGLGPEELVLILIVVVVLFGAKKLPDLARGSGQALRIFKSEMKGFNDDDETTAASVATPEQLEIQKLKADIAAEQAKSTPASETVAAAIKTPEQLEIEQLKAQLAAAQRIEHDATS